MSKNITIALKISGETFKLPINSEQTSDILNKFSYEIKQIHEAGIKIVIIVGGGNLCRGRESTNFLNRGIIDQIGMLGTLINSLALQDSLEKLSVQTRVQSAIRITYICEPFISRKALRHLEKGRVVIFATGTGNPFFSTDTASVLRALEMRCNYLLKATQVSGVFDKDPKKYPNAKFYSKISYDDILNQKLKIMDQSAISLARDNFLPIKIFSQNENFLEIIRNNGKYTLIS